MPSKLWTEPFEAAIASPLDYHSLFIFIAEAKDVLEQIAHGFDRYQIKFHVDDRSVEKAIWMLYTDVLDALLECLESLERRKHRIAGKIFRDVYEALAVAHLLFEGDETGSKLKKWYSGKTFAHKPYKKFLKSIDPELSKTFGALYGRLSKCTHHVYMTLLPYHPVGPDGMLKCGSRCGQLTRPATIFEYTWMTSYFINLFIDEMGSFHFIPDDDYRAWSALTGAGPVRPS